MASSLNNELCGKEINGNFEPDGKLLDVKKQIHKTIEGVTDDLDNFRLNKAVARIRELTNTLSDIKSDDERSLAIIKEGMETAILLFAPMIPHLSEELWSLLGNGKMAIDTPWPVADKKYLVDDTVTIAVQLNGKLKATIELAKDAPKESAEKSALDNPKIREALAGKEIRKIIVVPNRIVNVVA